MIHFPSSLPPPNGLPRRTDSLQLNATQQKLPSHKIFLTVEEELHDARRVHSHGQEEDLRLALNMLIHRLSLLSTMLSDAYKTSADLEVQLNVAKSNLQLVISNNEMLEDALKREPSGHAARDVGWRRTSAPRAHTMDDAFAATVPSPRPGASTPTHSATPSGDYAGTPTTATMPPPPPLHQADSPATTQETTRFFKFRFTNSSPNPAASSSSSSVSSSRPGTPSQAALNSPAVPPQPAPAPASNKDKEKELAVELEKERTARKKARKEKEDLEAELEALSQALFEEANKMVATERIRLADVEEELREAKLEKEALRSALRLLEGENVHLRSSAGSSPVAAVVASSSPSNSSQDTAHTTTPEEEKDKDKYKDKETSPGTKHLPPSLSSRARARVPMPTHIPPPQPLAVPTTPFEWSNGSDGETPKRRGGWELELEPETEPGVEAEAGMEAEREAEGAEQRMKERMGGVEVEVGLGLGGGVVPPSLPAQVPARVPAETRTHPPSESTEEEDKQTQTPIETLAQQQRKPPSLHLFPQEHEREQERDPWADALPPPRAIWGATV